MKIIQYPEKEKNTLTNERNTENLLKVRRLRNYSVFISGPVKLLSRSGKEYRELLTIDRNERSDEVMKRSERSEK